MDESEFSKTILELGDVSQTVADGIPALRRGSRAVSMFDPIPTFPHVLLVLLEKRGMLRKFKRIAYTRKFDEAINWLCGEPVGSAVSPEDGDADRARAMIQLRAFNFSGDQ